MCRDEQQTIRVFIPFSFPKRLLIAYILDAHFKEDLVIMKNGKHWKEWSEVEWTNVYKLYEASQTWDLDTCLEFADFKKKIQKDSKFADLHYVKAGMDSPDYTPWS